jgi:hypothetical protein
MAKTSAERQAAYRAKRVGHDSGERRINTWVSAETYKKLEQLAISYGVTRRAVLELLVSHEDGALGELTTKAVVAKSVVARQPPAARELRRNSLGKVGGGAVGKLPAEKLPRNSAPKNDKEKKVARRPVQEPKHSQSPDDQYGFEF